MEVSVNYNSYQQHSVWQGGNILAIRDNFEKVYHTREEYQEKAP